jgi:hypothetical protein
MSDSEGKMEFFNDHFADLPRGQRTERSRCGLKPGACPHCIRYLEIDGDDARCSACRRCWPADHIAPCPRPATVAVRDDSGLEVDRVCAPHAALARRMEGNGESLSSGKFERRARLARNGAPRGNRS